MIWNKKRAQQLIDKLFEQKSLRIPPYRPDLVPGNVVGNDIMNNAGNVPEPQPDALREFSFSQHDF